MSQLLDDLKAYEEGVITSVNTARSTGVIDAFGKSVLKNAQGIPGVQQALQLANGLENELIKLTGAGSLPSRLADALLHSGNIFSGFVNAIGQVFNGRTYGTDTYFGAGDWMYHVKGVDPGPSTGVPDDAVYPAMMWYIDKLGIFISGRVHVGYLRRSVQDYMNLVSVNPYTTQDLARVTTARNVLLTYMPENPILGNWANTVGVFDQLLVNVGNNSPKTLAYLKQQYQIADSLVSEVISGLNSGNGDIYIYLAVFVVVIILLIIFFK